MAIRPITQGQLTRIEQMNTSQKERAIAKVAQKIKTEASTKQIMVKSTGDAVVKLSQKARKLASQGMSISIGR